MQLFENLETEGTKFNIEKINFLAMHINNQKLSFDIFTVLNIFMEHDLNILMIFVILILTHTMYCCLFLQIYLIMIQGHILLLVALYFKCLCYILHALF